MKPSAIMGHRVGLALLAFILAWVLSPALAEAQLAPVSTSSTATAAAVPATATAVPVPATRTSTPTPSAPRARGKKLKPLVRTGDYRNPQGSLNISGIIDVSTGTGQGTTIVFGVGLGYAVLTGVLPGVRGVLVTNSEDGIGGELAGTLTLTPPLKIAFTPFLYGEAGRRFASEGEGWMYGGGGGLYLGDPASRVSFQLGWVFRRVLRDDGAREDASGPLIGVTFRI